MDSYTLEQIVKGFANHRRIDVLYLLAGTPGISVEEVAESCQVEYKTIASHLRKMAASGLITKKYYGRRVEHRLTSHGEQAVKFLNCLS